MNLDRVKAVCPLCGWVSNVRRSLIGNKWGIDDIKCSPCFEERMTFVNLQLTPFEQALQSNKSNTDGKDK